MAVYNSDSMKEHVYVGFGDYEVSFEYDVSASIKVLWYDDDGVESPIKEEGVDYSIVVVSGIPYVRVVIDFGIGGVISIYRDTPLTQPYSWNDGENPAPTAIMRAIDRVVWMVQQFATIFDRALKIPRNEAADMTIPPLTTRRLMYASYDENGLPAVSGVPIEATVTPWSETLLLSPDAEEARTIMDTYSTTETDAKDSHKTIIGKLIAETFATQTTPIDENYTDICWSPELEIFCAVAANATLYPVMTSPDGKTWTERSGGFPNNNWYGICWSPDLNLFCAVAYSVGSALTGVMTSPDGINWTTRTTPSDSEWRSVCWSPELGIFCAIASDVGGTVDTVMTSEDGTTWTARTSDSYLWVDVCWSPELGRFSAISYGDGFVMTSSDGITWSAFFIDATQAYNSVCWSPDLGIFCAVAGGDTSFNCLYSSDGEIWNPVTLPSIEDYSSVCWAPEIGLFCAVSDEGTTNSIITSHNGLDWKQHTSPSTNELEAVCWSPKLAAFCAVSDTGTLDRAIVTTLYDLPDRISETADAVYLINNDTQDVVYNALYPYMLAETIMIATGVLTDVTGVLMVTGVEHTGSYLDIKGIRLATGLQDSLGCFKGTGTKAIYAGSAIYISNANV